MSVARREAVIVDTSRSPHALLHPLPLGAVRLTDQFWAPRRERNAAVTLPSQYKQCADTGRLDNFRRASGKLDGPFQGMYFNDSDIYKWLEAAAWTLADRDDPSLAATVATVTTEIAAAQQPDGYLNTYFLFERASERWGNLPVMHELYCAGHFIQAAIACHRALGDADTLAVALRLAEHICATFGKGDGQRPGTCGHAEIEMALVELARETGDRKYLSQAQYFIDARGHGLLGGTAYLQDHLPLRLQRQIVGHAVRAVYLNCGAADLYAETGEADLRTALEGLWHNMTERRMYAGGGIGSRHAGEEFGEDYELPNARAYAETCAGIGSLMWNWRMLLIGGDASYADAIEQVLYNNILAGGSLDGEHYFYHNPLAAPDTYRRVPWFGCACCPPNLARMLASLPGYFYSRSANGLWMHLYAAHEAKLTLQDGSAIELTQRTDYPFDGDIAIEITGSQSDAPWSLFLRVPAWAKGATLAVNGKAIDAAPGSYAEINRPWQPGDMVELKLPMEPRRIASHPYALENAGRVALARGPLLYCLESVDHPGIDLRDIELPNSCELRVESRPDLLGGVSVIVGEATVAPLGTEWESALYREGVRLPDRNLTPVAITAVPYCTWANRDAGRMLVWIGSADRK